MADNSASFVSKVTGEVVTPASIVRDELSYLQNLVDAGVSDITDANIGSELRNLLESVGITQWNYLYENDMMGQKSLVKYADGNWLDDIGEMYNINRKLGERASGYVRFTLSSPRSTDYTIDSNVRILNRKTGLSYMVVDDVVISSSQMWATAFVVAEAVGEEYNCDAGTLTAFDSYVDLPRDLECTNLDEFSNGSDVESDASYRERILEYLRGGRFGSVAYYQSLCENLDGVHDVKFISPVVLNEIEDGRHKIEVNGVQQSCTGCTAVCVVNSNVDNTNVNLVKDVQRVLSDQRYLILGHEFHVQSAYDEQFFFKIDYYAESGLTATESEVMNCLKTLFYGGTYDGKVSITYNGYDIGETVDKVDIINALENMKEIHHVEGVKLLCWHGDLKAGIDLLSTYKANKGISGFKYSDILDYPDEDDKDFDVSLNSRVPYWKYLSETHLEAKAGQSVYELVIDDYYFYKVKDNTNSGVANAGEYPLNTGLRDYWLWGQKSFDSITVNTDVAPRVGVLSSKQNTAYDGSDYAHLLQLRKIN